MNLLVGERRDIGLTGRTREGAGHGPIFGFNIEGDVLTTGAMKFDIHRVGRGIWIDVRRQEACREQPRESLKGVSLNLFGGEKRPGGRLNEAGQARWEHLHPFVFQTSFEL